MLDGAKIIIFFRQNNFPVDFFIRKIDKKALLAYELIYIRYKLIFLAFFGAFLSCRGLQGEVVLFLMIENGFGRAESGVVFS